MNILDIERGHSEYVLTGTYRTKLKDTAEVFNYDIVDSPNKTYGKIINNLIYDTNLMVIKTNNNLNYKIKGYVIDQDDKMFMISRIQKYLKSVNKYVLKVTKNNPSTEYVIALIEVDNVMELK